jgi:hypothetical protein
MVMNKHQQFNYVLLALFFDACCAMGIPTARAMTIRRTMVMKKQIHRFLRAARAEVTAP